MKNGKIYVAGIGPGCEDDITPAVKKAVSVSDVVVGYNYYFSFIQLFVMEGRVCRFRNEKRMGPGSDGVRVCRTG